MKRLCVLMAAVSLLFLWSCQQNEKVELTSELLEQDNGCGFKKEGDLRDPSEFLTPERIKEIQEVFKKFEGKKLKNPVIQLPATKSAGVFPGANDSLIIYETDIPLGKVIEGKDLYIDTDMRYLRSNEYFNAKVDYHLGIRGPLVFGFKRDGDEIWKSENDAGGTIRRLIFFNCHLNIKLNNTPNYNLAIVTFTLQMVWDQTPGLKDVCEVVVNQRDVNVRYFNGIGI